MPATDLRAARLEEARRELQRRAVSRARHTPFHDWLGEVTPAYTFKPAGMRTTWPAGS